MMATWNTLSGSAMMADRNGGERMPFFMQNPCTATPASASITRTSVSTLVSLFARLIAVLSLLLVVVVLVLSGLTGRIDLVGLNTTLDANAKQGV
jgi:hypothetical protein